MLRIAVKTQQTSHQTDEEDCRVFKRIQAKENGQHTPDGSDVHFFAGVNHSGVALGEQEDPRRVDSEVHQPLVIQEEAQHWTRGLKRNHKTVSHAGEGESVRASQTRLNGSALV